MVGELELTYLNTTCRAANVQALLQDNQVREATAELIATYEDVHYEDRRGTRIREAFIQNNRDVEITGRDNNILSPDILDRLVRFLNCEAGEETYVNIRDGIRSPGHVQVTDDMSICSHVALRGVSYKSDGMSPRDSNIIFRRSSDLPSEAGRIKMMFRHSRSHGKSHIEEIFLVVERLVELTRNDVKYDPYRRFDWVGGRLCYDRSDPDVMIIRPRHIVSHFARTSMTVPGISTGCIHILPLDRVSAQS